MQMKHILISTLIAAAAMGLSTYAATPTDADFTKPVTVTDGTVADTQTLSEATILDYTSVTTANNKSTAVGAVATEGNAVKLVGGAKEFSLETIGGDGSIWIASGYWHADTSKTKSSVFTGNGDVHVFGASHLQLGTSQAIGNNLFLGATSNSHTGTVFEDAALRVGVWNGFAAVALSGTTSIMSEGSKIVFQGGKEKDDSTLSTLSIATLAGAGDLALAVFSGAGKLTVSNADSYSGAISLDHQNMTLEWLAGTSATQLAGIRGVGKVIANSNSGMAISTRASETNDFSGTFGSADNALSLSLSGSGTQAFTGTSWFSSVSVGNGATLDLSGGNVTLAEAIQNSGTVTLSGKTVFALDKLTATDDTYSLISGNPVSNTTGVSFTLDGMTLASSRVSVSTNSGYAVTVRNYTDLVWAGTESSSEWNRSQTNTVWTSETVGGKTVFLNGDSVTFDSTAANRTVSVTSAVVADSVTVKDDYAFAFGSGNSVAASTLSIENGKTLTLSGTGKLSVSSIASTGTLALGKETAFAIAGENNFESGCTDFGNVTGNGRIEFAAAGSTTENRDYSWVKLSESFTGTLSITSGVLDVLEKQGKTSGDGWSGQVASQSAIDTSRLGGATQIELNGGGILFRNANNTDSTASHYSDVTFDKAIVVGENGGAIRLYQNGNVTLKSTISGSGTLVHTDGGTLTFTNTVNLGSFSADAGVTVFAGETTIGQMNFNGGTVKVTNGTVLDLTNNKNNRTGVWGSSSILMIDGEKSTVKISTGTWEKGTSLGTAYAQSQLQISNGGTLEVKLAQKNEGEYASKRGFSITGGEGTYRYSGTEASYVTHNTDSGQHIGLADGKNSTLIFEVVEAGATLEVTKVVADTSLSSRETDGALKKTGAGTLELKPNDGANNFTGSVTIAEGKLVAGSANALGTGADTNVVKIAGGQLAIAEGVKLAQTNIEIALGDAYKTTNGAAVAAISGANKLASGTTITLSLENEAMNVAAEAAQDSYRIYDGTLANGVTIKLSDSLERLWKLEAVVGQEGVYALVAIPEPSLFGLLAGATALGFSMSSRRRRKKP